MAPQPAAVTAAARKRCLYLRKKRKNHKFVVQLRDPKDNGSDTEVLLVQKMNNNKKKNSLKLKMNKKKSSLKLTELPGDLLVGAILSGLHPADRMRFCATCKQNHSLITTAGPEKNQSLETDQLPWLVTFRYFSCWSLYTAECRLYEPTHRRGQPPYASYEIESPKEEGFIKMLTQVRASKLGWLLFSWPKEVVTRKNSRPETTSFLLFSPFSRRLIKLPDLKDSIDYFDRKHNLVAAFSSSPSSSCIYFVLTQYVILGKVTISTLKQQQQTKWKSVVFDQLIGRIDSVAYLDGLFYCVSGRGYLAAYDPFHENWTIVVRSSELINRDRLFPCLRNFYILEFHGHLLLVCRDAPKRGVQEVCSLFEFNSSTKTWVEKTSLEDGAIFLPCCGSSFAVSTAPSSDAANKIYFYGFGAPTEMYYSFKDGQSYLCHDGSSKTSSSYWSSAIPRGMWIQQPTPLPALSPS